jgi:hypothetical protein
MQWNAHYSRSTHKIIAYSRCNYKRAMKTTKNSLKLCPGLLTHNKYQKNSCAFGQWEHYKYAQAIKEGLRGKCLAL